MREKKRQDHRLKKKDTALRRILFIEDFFFSQGYVYMLESFTDFLAVY